MGLAANYKLFFNPFFTRLPIPNRLFINDLQRSICLNRPKFV